MSVIAFSSSIGPVPIDCVISEKHTSELEITEIPVETGAKITDHAVVMPKKVTLELADSSAAGAFNALVAFQESRVPFAVVTGLKVYTNMLIKRVDAQRDATHSKVLKATVDLQEIIIVNTSYAADPSGDGSIRGQPGGKNSTKSAAPTSGNATNPSTADRASQTIQRGDAAVTTASPADQSYLSSIFGAQ